MSYCKNTRTTAVSIAIIIVVVLVCFKANDFKLEPITSGAFNLKERNEICSTLNAKAVYEFHEELARVSFGNWEWNYVDKQNNLIAQENFHTVTDFKDGIALVKTNSKFYFINTQGENIFKELYDDATPFSEGIAVVSKDQNYFFINNKGKNIFDKTFSHAQPFVNGYAVVFESNKVKLIDIKGHYVSREYDRIANGGDSFLVLDQGTLKLLTKDGEEKQLNSSYLSDYDTSLFASDGVFYLESSNPTDGVTNVRLIDSQGEIIGNFPNAESFSENLAAVQDHAYFGGGAWYFIDKEGNMPFNKKYDHVGSFSDSIAYVVEDGKWYFINKNGKRILSETFDEASNFEDGIANVVKDGERFFIDVYGNKFCSKNN